MRRSARGPTFVLLALLLSCAGRQRTAEEPAQRHVLLVQVDGLTEGVLRTYLGATASRAPDRVLHRLVRATQAGEGHVTLLGATTVPALVTVLPSLAATADATLLTGAPPSAHLVRGDGLPLARDVRTLHEALSDQSEPSASAGFLTARGATYDAPGATDEERILALAAWLAEQEAPPRLVAVRFAGLARTTTRGGGDRALEALGEADALLSRLLETGGLAPTHLVLTGGYGVPEPASRPAPIGLDVISAFVPGRTAIPAGALVLVPDGGAPAAASLSEMKFFDRILLRGPSDLQVHDPELGGLRPLLESERAGVDLERRLLALTNPGDVVALGRREGCDRNAACAHFVASAAAAAGAAGGGASVEESEVLLLVAGAGFGGTRAPASMPLEDVAPTVLELLGVPVPAPGPGAGQPRLAELGKPRRMPYGLLTRTCEARDGVVVVGRPDDERVAAVASALRAVAPRLGVAPDPAPAVEVCRSHEDLSVAPLPDVASFGADAGAAVTVVVGPRTRIVAHTAALRTLLGPEALSGEVEGDAGRVAAVAGAYLRLARGVRAAFDGFGPKAASLLSPTPELAPDTAGWRALVRTLAARLSAVELDEAAEAAAIASAGGPDAAWLRALAGGVDALTLEAAPGSGSSATPEPAPRPLPDAATFEGDRRRFAVALRALERPVADACAPLDPAAQRAGLERAFGVFRELGSPCLAVQAGSRALELSSRDAHAAAEVPELLRLSELDDAGWCRRSATRVLAAQATGAGQPQLAARAAGLHLAAFERDLAEDRVEGWCDRALGRSVGIVWLQGASPGATRQALDRALQCQRFGRNRLLAHVVSQLAPQLLPVALGILSGNPQALEFLSSRLSRLAEILEREAPTGGSSSPGLDARLERGLLLLLRSGAALLQGDRAVALETSRAADETLGPVGPLLVGRRNASGGDAASTAAWGPFLKAGALGASSVLLGLDRDAPGASAAASALVGVGRAIVEDELDSTGLSSLRPQVAAVARPVDAGVRYVVARMLEHAEASAREELRQALVGLDVPLAEGEARGASRWLILLEIAAKDALWLVEQSSAGATADRTHVAAATAKLERLVADWRPTVQTGVGKTALLVLLAGQRAVQLAPEIGDRRDLAALRELDPLRQALREVARQARAELPRERVLAAARETDGVAVVAADAAVGAVELLVEERPKGRPAPDVGPEVRRRLRELSESLAGVEGESPTALALVLAAQGKGREALDAVERGRSAARRSALSTAPYVFDLCELRAALYEGDLPRVMRVAGAVDHSCPGAAWTVELARAHALARSGDLAGARTAARRYLGGARRALTGGYSGTATWSTVEDGLQYGVSLGLDPGPFAIAEAELTFEFGYGFSIGTPAGTTAQWKLEPKGSVSVAATDALLAEALFAMLAGEEEAADVALSALLGLAQGLDPARLAGPGWLAGPDAHRGSIQVRDARLALWVLTLAELRGHRNQARALLTSALAGGPEWAPGKDVCSEAERAQALPEGTPDLVRNTRCLVPAAAKLHGLEALRPVVHLRARRLAGESVDDAVWRKALAQASKAAPKAVPPWAAGLDEAWATQKPRKAPAAAGASAALLRAALGDGAGYEAAAKAGLPCEATAAAGLASARSSSVALAPFAARCGPNPFTAGVHFYAAVAEPDPARAQALAAGSFELAQALPAFSSVNADMHRNLLAVAELAAARAAATDAPGAATRLRAHAGALGASGYAAGSVRLRALADAIELASGGTPAEPPKALLDELLAATEPQPHASRFLKELVFRATTQEAARAAARAYVEARR